MKHITAVYNLKHHSCIYTGTSVQDHNSHTVNLDNPAELWLFKFVIRYLHKLTAQRVGFFSCTSGGWSWLRYIDPEATK